MQKSLCLLTAMSLTLLLSACNNNNEDTQTSEIDTSYEDDTTSEDTTEYEDTTSSEVEDDSGDQNDIGEITEYYNSTFDQTGKTGPITVLVNNVQTYDLAPNEENIEEFDGKDLVHIIAISMTVTNSVDKDVAFFADQSTLVTDTKEQIDADIVYSDDVGGDFLGKVEKEGVVYFFAENEIKDIKKLKLNFTSPFYNKTQDAAGKELSMNLNLK